MFLRHNLPGILWALLIFILCSLPADEFPHPPLFENFDKAVHFYLYAQFSFLLITGFRKQEQSRVLNVHAVIIAFAISFFYGIFIEVLQEFVFTSRSFESLDILADFCGTMFGIFCRLILKK